MIHKIFMAIIDFLRGFAGKKSSPLAFVWHWNNSNQPWKQFVEALSSIIYELATNIVLILFRVLLRAACLFLTACHEIKASLSLKAFRSLIIVAFAIVEFTNSHCKI